jgi:hypothetical protein
MLALEKNTFSLILLPHISQIYLTSTAMAGECPHVHLASRVRCLIWTRGKASLPKLRLPTDLPKMAVYNSRQTADVEFCLTNYCESPLIVDGGAHVSTVLFLRNLWQTNFTTSIDFSPPAPTIALKMHTTAYISNLYPRLEGNL